MNRFTQGIIADAYAHAAHALKGKKAVDRISLDRALAHLWFIYRRGILAQWADALQAACSQASLDDDQLEGLAEIVDDLLCETHQFTELPLWEPADDLERAEIRDWQSSFVAEGLAGLWWMAHEGSEIAPLLEYQEGELDAWLKARQEEKNAAASQKPRQLSFFGAAA